MIHYKFKKDSDREEAMFQLDKLRQKGKYEHEECYEDCKRRGI